MRRIDFHIEAGGSIIAVGESLKNVVNYLPEAKLFIITDMNVRKIYESSFPAATIIEIGAGETSKALSVIEDICLQLSALGADRQSFLLGIGGGVVCDITGLVASLYMRGVRHGFVSTTLLSQVDASVGGKTGVNAGNLKNIIGTFKLPEFVICDVSMLSTLPDEEYVSGLGELIKSAAIADRELFFDLKQRFDLVLSRNTDVLEEMVYRSLRIKTGIVECDFEESGQRRLLNFGHTLGHAIEMLTKVPHGVAVMQGMILAAQWSAVKGLLGEDDFLELKSLINRLKVQEIGPIPEGFNEIVLGDKKRSGSFINFVFLKEIGHAVVEKVPAAEIFEFTGTTS